MKQQLRTVLIFAKLSTKRFFRDGLAIFFVILFPLIFLAVFGGLSSGDNNDISFKVAVINQSDAKFSRDFAGQIGKSKTFEVDKQLKTVGEAKAKMTRSQIDGIIVLPKEFGVVQEGQAYPSGRAEVLYNHSSSGTGQTLTTILEGTFRQVNAKFVDNPQPFTVSGREVNQKSLKPFDYTFAGLVGFSIIGLGIFGPVSVFPELKKQGVLRRLHTTPLRVWQYFTATMLSQAAVGVVSIIIQFAVAIKVFHLKVYGYYPEIFLFTILSIFMILGIGLAIGGWAKNERQAQPLSNIVVFPMLFLSGTFFPRYLMPEWLQHVTTYLPLSPVIDGLRLLTTEGRHLFDLGPQLGVMAVWFILTYAIAFKVFRWE